MLAKVQSTLTKLLAPGEPLLIGVSGGPDSVALLDVLVSSGWRPHVCHLNHKLRGADSDADAEFVRELAGRYGLPCTIEARPVVPVGGVTNPDRSRLKTAPTITASEDAARRARFDYFTEVAGRTGIKKLALAHTADDQVETFLLRLLRGAGVPGLVGIWPERQIGPLRVIRPMLAITRAEVLEYLQARGLPSRIDATNADTRFTRNRIRHELLPLLEREFNPAIREVLRRTAEILRDEDFYLLRHVAQTFYMRTSRGDALHVPTLNEFPVAVQRRVIRFWLGGEDENGQRFMFDHIESVRETAGSESPSAEVHLPDDLVVYREYEWLRKARREELEPVHGQWPLATDGETVIRKLGVRFVCHPELVEGSPESRREIPHSVRNDNKSEERMDLDALGPTPFIRTWKEGDRFQPLGMSGDKKLQDFFVDEKVPRLQRGRTPLVCATDGRIAWVVGYRIAEPFKVTQQTRRILRVKVMDDRQEKGRPETI